MYSLHTFKSELGENLTVFKGKYPVKPCRTFIVLQCDDGQPYAHITVNTEAPIEDDEVAIKTWGFNKGISEELFDTGLFEDTGKRFRSGFAVGEVWRLK